MAELAKIFNAETGVLLFSQCKVTTTRWEATKGLIGTNNLSADEALFIRDIAMFNLASIHTMFMSFTIDVVFLSAQNTVIKVIVAVPPWQLWISCAGACHVLETASNRCTQLGIVPGINLVIDK